MRPSEGHKQTPRTGDGKGAAAGGVTRLEPSPAGSAAAKRRGGSVRGCWHVAPSAENAEPETDLAPPV